MFALRHLIYTSILLLKVFLYTYLLVKFSTLDSNLWPCCCDMNSIDVPVCVSRHCKSTSHVLIVYI